LLKEKFGPIARPDSPALAPILLPHEPPVTKQRDDRSPIVLAYMWSFRITSISLEMVVPLLIGYWLDQRWGTGVLCLVIGGILGFFTAFSSLLRLTKSSGKDRPLDRMP
jgi:F0F1-type ATP synthase assembly protein I